MDNTAYVLQAPGYIVGTFIFTYATTVLGAPRNFVGYQLASIIAGGPVERARKLLWEASTPDERHPRLHQVR
jgi:hypothetical protein